MLACDDIDLNYTDSIGCGPVHYAMALNNMTAFDLITNNKTFDPQVIDRSTDTLLHHAIRYDRYEMALKLVKIYSANVNTPNSDLMTPVHYAAKYNMRRILVVMVLKGASVTLKDAEGRTPTDLAAEAGNMVMVDDLLKNQSNVEEKINRRITKRGSIKAPSPNEAPTTFSRRGTSIGTPNAEKNPETADDEQPQRQSVVKFADAVESPVLAEKEQPPIIEESIKQEPPAKENKDSIRSDSEIELLSSDIDESEKQAPSANAVKSAKIGADEATEDESVIEIPAGIDEASKELGALKIPGELHQSQSIDMDIASLSSNEKIDEAVSPYYESGVRASNNDPYHIPKSFTTEISKLLDSYNSSNPELTRKSENGEQSVSIDPTLRYMLVTAQNIINELEKQKAKLESDINEKNNEYTELNYEFYKNKAEMQQKVAALENLISNGENEKQDIVAQKDRAIEAKNQELAESIAQVESLKANLGVLKITNNALDKELALQKEVVVNRDEEIVTLTNRLKLREEEIAGKNFEQDIKAEIDSLRQIREQLFERHQAVAIQETEQVKRESYLKDIQKIVASAINNPLSATFEKQVGAPQSTEENSAVADGIESIPVEASNSSVNIDLISSKESIDGYHPNMTALESKLGILNGHIGKASPDGLLKSLDIDHSTIAEGEATSNAAELREQRISNIMKAFETRYSNNFLNDVAPGEAISELPEDKYASSLERPSVIARIDELTKAQRTQIEQLEETVRQNLEKYDQERTEFSERIHELGQEIIELKADNEAKYAKIDGDQQKIEELETRIKQRVQEQTDFSERIHELGQEIINLQADNEVKVAKINSIESELEEAKVNFKNQLIQEQTELSERIHELGQYIIDLTVQNKAKADNIDEANVKIEDLETSIKKHVQERTELSERINELGQEIIFLKAENEANTSNIKTSKDKIEETASSLRNQLLQERNECSKRIHELGQEIIDLKAENQFKDGKIKNAELKLGETETNLNDQILRERTELSDRIHELGQEIINLSAQNDFKSLAIKNAQDKIEDMELNFNEQLQERAQEVGFAEQLSYSMIQYQTKIQALSDEKQQLIDVVSKSEVEIKEKNVIITKLKSDSAALEKSLVALKAQDETNSQLLANAQTWTQKHHDIIKKSLEKLCAIISASNDHQEAVLSKLADNRLPKSLAESSGEPTIEAILNSFQSSRSVSAKIESNLLKRIDALYQEYTATFGDLERVCSEASDLASKGDSSIYVALHSVMRAQQKNAKESASAISSIKENFRGIFALNQQHQDDVKELIISMTTDLENGLIKTCDECEVYKKKCDASNKALEDLKFKHQHAFHTLQSQASSDNFALAASKATLESQIAILKTEITSLKDEIGKKEEVIVKNAAEYASLSQLKKESDTSNASIKTDYAALLKSKEDLYATYSNLNSEKEALARLNAELELSKKTLQNSYQSLLSSKKEVESSYAALQTDYSALVNEKIGTESVLKALQSEYNGVLKAKSDVEASLATSKSEFEAISKSKKELHVAYTNVKAELESLTGVNNDLETSLALSKAENEKLAKAKKDVDAANASLKANYDTIRNERDDLENQSDVLKTEHKNAVDQLNRKFNEQRKQHVSEVEKLNKDQQELQEELQAANKRLDEAKGHHKNKVADLDRQVAVLLDQFEAKSNENTESLRKLHAFEAKLRTYDAQKLQYERELEVLREEQLENLNKHARLENDILRLNSDKSRLMKESQTLENENDSLKEQLELLEEEKNSAERAVRESMFVSQKQVRSNDSDILNLRIKTLENQVLDEKDRRDRVERDSRKILEECKLDLQKVAAERQELFAKINEKDTALREAERKIKELIEVQKALQLDKADHIAKLEATIKELRNHLKSTQEKVVISKEKMRKSFDKQVEKIAEQFDTQIQERIRLDKAREKNDEEIKEAFDRQIKKMQDEIYLLRRELSNRAQAKPSRP